MYVYVGFGYGCLVLGFWLCKYEWINTRFTWFFCIVLSKFEWFNIRKKYTQRATSIFFLQKQKLFLAPGYLVSSKWPYGALCICVLLVRATHGPQDHYIYLSLPVLLRLVELVQLSIWFMNFINIIFCTGSPSTM